MKGRKHQYCNKEYNCRLSVVSLSQAKLAAGEIPFFDSVEIDLM